MYFMSMGTSLREEQGGGGEMARGSDGRRVSVVECNLTDKTVLYRRSGNFRH